MTIVFIFVHHIDSKNIKIRTVVNEAIVDRFSLFAVNLTE